MTKHNNNNKNKNKKNKSDDDVVIVSALRTPLCRSRKGSLDQVPAATLFQTVLQGTLDSPPLRSATTTTTNTLSGCRAEIQDICVGNVLLPPSGYAALRMAHIVAGIPAETTSFHTVNRQCASGLQACATIANRIAQHEITMGIGAGVESMSCHPMHTLKPLEPSDWQEQWSHPTAMDCLLPMGITSENVVHQYGLQRHELDDFAAQSHQKAHAAQQKGHFAAEIVPVRRTSNDNNNNNNDNDTVVQHDDGIRPQTTRQILSKLKPVFTLNGSTTAGNASQTTDGAAAIVFTTRAEAVRRQLPILGIWRGYSTVGVPPRLMGIGPAVAIPHVLQQAGLTTDDIDVFEINEAFASQAYWCIQELQLDPVKVNPNGGAIALGHPLGCTGARMVVTLLHELRRRRTARYGVVSMCVGSGMGAAAVLEVEPQAAL